MYLLFYIFSLLSYPGWLTDYDQAALQAKTEKKQILLVFSGSDWCRNCLRVEKNIFELPDFKNWAKEKVVLLQADFPRSKKHKLSDAQTAKNEALAEKYNKAGTFPLVLLLDEEGKVLKRMEEVPESVEEFLQFF